MKIHCPLCGEELKVEPSVDYVNAAGVNDWGRSVITVTFASKEVPHACKKPEVE